MFRATHRHRITATKSSIRGDRQIVLSSDVGIQVSTQIQTVIVFRMTLRELLCSRSGSLADGVSMVVFRLHEDHT
jgi:hypothetical protein